MSLKTYNSIDLRYASGDLAKHNFVKEEEVTKLLEEIEELRASRSYWHTMANNVDECPDI